MTQTSAPKFVKEVTVKVMKTNKATELFQIMVIMNLNLGNLFCGGKHSKEQIGYGGEGEGSIIGGIG